MACGSCSGTNGVSKGCGNKGHCSSGSCNKLNTYDWLAKREIPLPTGQNIVEVSFKNGAHKDFFFMDHTMPVTTGDMIVVNSGNGFDVGRLSLTGDLVSLQMKKKKVKADRIQHNVIRKANNRDLEKLTEARALEIPTMIKARAISRTLDIDMKLGDVEYQGDKRKATFYYTAEGRIDFRELVRAYAREFKVKIEMRQIGSRQESARIGGIGSCGRELCCSTWLTDFKSVSTTAARYQYMAINQSKLSGQCGRLKCCLNYELDNYMDAISHFPEKADYVHTANGKARLMKIDIFKGLMYYSVSQGKGRSNIVAMDKEDVKRIIEMNKKGEKPVSLASMQTIDYSEYAEDEPDYEDVTGAVELPDRKRKSKRRNNRSKSKKGGKPAAGKASGKPSTKEVKADAKKPSGKSGNRRNRGKGPKTGNQQQSSNNKQNTNSSNMNAGKPASGKKDLGGSQNKNTTNSPQSDKPDGGKPAAKKGRNNRRNRGGRRKDGENPKQNSGNSSSDNKPADNTK